MILKLLAYASLGFVALNVAESAGFVEKGRYLPFLPRWEISTSALSDLHPFKNVKLPGDSSGSGYGFSFHKTENSPAKSDEPSMDAAENTNADTTKPAHDAIGALVERIDAEDTAPAAGPKPSSTKNPR